MVDLGTVGHIIWGITCLVTAILLPFLADFNVFKGNYKIICQTYCMYLIAQVMSSTLFVITYQDGLSTKSFNILRRFTYVFLLIAATVYLSIAIILSYGIRMKYNKLKLLLKIELIPLCILIILVHIISVDTGIIIVFCYYMICIICVCTGLIDIYLITSKKNNEYNIPKYIWILTLISVIVGILDFIIPAGNTFGIRFKNVTFWTRLCDSILYVPLIIPLFVVLDKYPKYQKIMNNDIHVHNLDDNIDNRAEML